MGEIEIRGYRAEDRDGCRELWAELTLWHRQIYGDPTIGGTDPGLHFDRHLETAGAEHLLVAVEGGRVIGLTGYLLAEGEAEVEPLVVRSTHRGRGLGSALLEAVVGRLEGTGIRFLNVRPATRNVKALEFFRERGFDKLGRIELFIDYTNRDWKKGLRMFDLDFEY